MRSKQTMKKELVAVPCENSQLENGKEDNKCLVVRLTEVAVPNRGDAD